MTKSAISNMGNIINYLSRFLRDSELFIGTNNLDKVRLRQSCY
jgi:hypothetical protein